MAPAGATSAAVAAADSRPWRGSRARSPTTVAASASARRRRSRPRNSKWRWARTPGRPNRCASATPWSAVAAAPSPLSRCTDIGHWARTSAR
ncbi:hypothetical protein [Lysobacter gummosus]|uniref:hypothetical protein n=1 Tax=Lysobacter gummosus TaxID=262324 RepID=UPI003624B051